MPTALGTLAMECFRIDESGYTGFDLLNADQRFQGAAAIAISDQDAARLISEQLTRLIAEQGPPAQGPPEWGPPECGRPWRPPRAPGQTPA